jgi:L-ascorbate metabolism protein UlaG (beta-lactamase superfamily)
MNFFGIWIITDPVLFPRIGIRLPFFTVGPKRLTQPALRFEELPPIDLVLLSHAHFDHFDRRSLRRFGRQTAVITAHRTADLLGRMRFRSVTELRWNDATEFACAAGSLRVRAVRVNHWGARLRTDTWRGYNGYVIESQTHPRHRVLFAGDTAWMSGFAELNEGIGFDLAIVAIGAYNPWIRSHATPEQAVAMCDAAGARFIMPVHHQTFRLSVEPAGEPLARFEAALAAQPERIAVRQVGETFVFPA